MEQPLGQSSLSEFVLAKFFCFSGFCFFYEAALHVSLEGVEKGCLFTSLVVHEGLSLSKSVLLNHLSKLHHEQTIPVHLDSLSDPPVFNVGFHCTHDIFS